MSSIASSATYREVASTIAIGSPTHRTSWSASSLRGGWGASGPIIVCHHDVTIGLRSAAVKTARTPSRERAAPTSSWTIRPRATGLRRNATCHVSGHCTSST
jgi:hypothetical protein